VVLLKRGRKKKEKGPLVVPPKAEKKHEFVQSVENGKGAVEKWKESRVKKNSTGSGQERKLGGRWSEIKLSFQKTDTYLKGSP